MHTEVEVKFLEIDPVALRQRLRKLQAELVQAERIMRRRNYDLPNQNLAKQGAWIRVRDEGSQVTISYKQTVNTTATGTNEINLAVDDFDRATEFLDVAGFMEKSYQETKRESWKLGSVEIEIDTWPWLPTFVELEGPSEAQLQTVAQQLELPWDKHRGGDVTPVYQHYYEASATEIIHARLTFADACPWAPKLED